MINLNELNETQKSVNQAQGILEKSYQKKLNDVKNRILQGETTGDVIDDILVASFYNPKNPELKIFLEQLNQRVEENQGELVMYVQGIVDQDEGIDTLPRLPQGFIAKYSSIGILEGQLKPGDKRFYLPTNKHLIKGFDITISDIHSNEPKQWNSFNQNIAISAARFVDYHPSTLDLESRNYILIGENEIDLYLRHGQGIAHESFVTDLETYRENSEMTPYGFNDRHEGLIKRIEEEFGKTIKIKNN
jgi:hypothetical protein